MKLALPLVLQEDLATSRGIVSFFAKDDSTAYEGQATEILRIVIEDRNGKLRLEAAVTDPQTQRNQQVISIEEDSAAGILPVANQLAKRIDPRAGNFPTKSLRALKTFTSAAGTQDLSQRLQLLTEAVSADPAFGLAHIALIETAAQVAPQSLPSLVAAGTTRHDQFAPLERARWNALVARYSHAPLQQQADTAAAVLKIAPHNIDALATLGANRFLQGNGTEGERFLRQAIALSPANINLPLQLANGLIESKRFSDAIAVLKPLSSNASAIPALAVATLLSGKTKEATTIFQNLVNLLPPGSTEANFLRAQWEAICTGKKTLSLLSSTTSATPGYSAFLSGQFEEAVQLWQNIVQQTGDADLRARAMLAASLHGAGRTADANKIVVMPFVPDLRDVGIGIAFNQMRQWLRL
ncbi:MAG: tetratricopeptide repeat protein [Bryobacteraceae bacterium]